MLLGFYFDIFLLSLIVLVLVFIRVKWFLGFGKNFTNMFFLLLLMVLFNFLCLFVKDILIFLSILVFLSFYSMFLILYGYGTGFKVFIVVLFKSLADVLIIVLLSNIIFLQLDCKLDSFMFCGLSLGVVLLLIFFIYSLFGVFGFWLFWAMEASYFISCFMHSCGFISVGLIFFIKLSLLGVLEELYYFLNFVTVVSLLSYLFFLLLFFVVKDCKKSFGFYSASSICFLLFISVNFPLIAISYFFLSSVIKILIFEVLSFLNKVNFIRWFLCLLFVFNIFIYSLFFLLNTYSFLHMEIIYFIFVFKVFSLIIFVFKVFNLSDFHIKGLSFNFFIFLVSLLVFNKLFSVIFFNSWLTLSLSYFFLFMILFKFNFYSFKSFSISWLKICDTFVKFFHSISFLLTSFINIFTISPLFLFKVFFNKFIDMNNAQLIFYCLTVPFIILIVF